MENINQRINRLIGQIEGIRRMIEKRRNCEEIIQQILAARQALSKIGLIILKEGLSKISPKEKEKMKKLISNAFRI